MGPNEENEARNIQKCKRNNRSKSGGQTKEERGLLQWFIVISRSRTDLGLKKCIGTFEFGLVPRTLFASDGSLLLAYDKATILHHLEKDATSQYMET